MKEPLDHPETMASQEMQDRMEKQDQQDQPPI